MLTHAFIYRTAINSATWITLSLFTTVIYLFIYWLVCLLCLWVGGGTDRTEHINILWYSQFALSYTSLRRGQCMAPYHLACYSKPCLFFPAPRQSLTFSHVVLSDRISPQSPVLMLSLEEPFPDTSPSVVMDGCVLPQTLDPVRARPTGDQLYDLPISS